MKGKKDEVKFAQLMRGLAAVFDVKGTLTPVKIELYFKALEDLTIEQIEKSVSELIRDREYTSIPLPAHIRKNIHPPVQALNGLSAWLIVEKCIEGGAKPKDPIINKAVDGMGGYQRLSLLPYSELTWTQKEFERRFLLLNEKRALIEAPALQKNRLKIVEINPKEKGLKNENSK